MRRALAASLLGLALVGCKKQSPPEAAPVVESSDEPSLPSRCSPLGEAFVVGEREAVPEGESEHLLPFSAEVGEAVVHDSGFAASATFFRKKARISGLVLLGADGRGARFVELGEARGDMGPPHLASRGSSLFVAVVEPGKDDRVIRLGKLEGTKVAFGGSVNEKRDESLALDLAVGARTGLLAWDEEGPEGGGIVLVSFDPATAAIQGRPRTISNPALPADTPKLVARDGGFVLAYVVRRNQGEKPSSEDRFETEEVGFRSIEAVFLDEKGERQGEALAITPPDGHVAAFDMTRLPDGALAIVWREDDGPSGSGGGRVLGALVRGTTVSEPIVLADEKVGSGTPGIAGRWISISDSSDVTRVGKLSPSFTLEGSLEADQGIGQGEVLAAEGDVLLVARPRGKAILLAAVRCGG